ncbi:MAG: hypothetical protein N4A43_02110 [Alphaproteobacteria bacterium]|jgi:uncharacterized membrane-anchored protein|nr:hypothetical protein [Alphaproteobacteria bacterium]
MKKTLIFIAQIILVLITVMFLINHQETISITVNDYNLETNTTYFAVYLFIFMATFSIVIKTLEAFVYAPKNIKKKIDYKNKLAGLEAIINGLFALSVENNKLAIKETKIANKKIPNHVMVHFLSAKSFMLEHLYEKAKKEYGKIIKDGKYRSLGFNGLIEIALLETNDDDVYSLSKQAVMLDSKNSYALLNLIDCQIDRNKISEAKDNLKKASKLKGVNKESMKYKLAEIAYVNSIDMQDKNLFEKAIKEISPYYDLDPDYLDLYINLLIANGQVRKAKNAVKKEWKKNPYNNIAHLWAKLSPSEEIKKVAHLKELLKDWKDSHIAFELIAKACIDVEMWGEAKLYLEKAIESEEKLGHYLLMAKVEKIGFKNADKHDFWLSKLERRML